MSESDERTGTTDAPPAASGETLSRGNEVSTVATTGDPVADRVIAKLIAALERGQIRVAFDHVNEIKRLGDAAVGAAADRLVPLLRPSPSNNDHLVRRVADLLGALGSGAARAVPDLLRLLDAPSQKLRLAVTTATCCMTTNEPGVVGPVLDLLQDDDLQVARRSLRNLCALAKSANPGVLARLRSTVTAAGLLRFLTDEDADSRQQAAETIDRLCKGGIIDLTPSPVPPARFVQTEENAEVRERASETLDHFYVPLTGDASRTQTSPGPIPSQLDAAIEPEPEPPPLPGPGQSRSPELTRLAEPVDTELQPGEPPLGAEEQLSLLWAEVKQLRSIVLEIRSDIRDVLAVFKHKPAKVHADREAGAGEETDRANVPKPTKRRTGHHPPSPQELLKMREALGLTQQQAANRVGVSLTTWRNWESGRNAPSAAATQTIENTFQLP